MRKFVLGLPPVHETQQFGGLVYWVADKAIGGTMFCMLNPDGGGLPVSFAAGSELFAELAELEGLRPAPYLARVFWMAAERWDVFRPSQWQQELRASHEITLEKLPAKTRKVLELPRAEQRKIVCERRKVLAAREAAAKAKSEVPAESED